MKKFTLYLAIAFCMAIVNNTNSQVFWTDDFNSTAPSSGTRSAPNHANTTDGSGAGVCGFGDYFLRTNMPTDPVNGLDETFSGFSGSYWRGEDLDGCITNPDVINFTSIDISGKTSLVFRGLFGANGSPVFEFDDYILIEYSIDGGPYQKGLAFENSTSVPGPSSALLQDTNFDGIGNGGSPLSTTLSQFSFSLMGTGNTLSLRLTASIDGITEEFGFDTFTVEGSVTDTTPPVFENSTPSSANISATGFRIDTDIDEAGHIYYVILAEGATAPTSSEVKSGTGSGGATAVNNGDQTVNSGGFTHNFSITSLTADTAYDVYVVAEDSSSNIQTNPTKVDVSTLDNVDPVFENSTPSATSIAGTSFTLNADIDENGTIYYVVVPDGVTAPTSTEVKAGTGSGGAPVTKSGNGSISSSPFSTTFSITGLTSEDSYDVYVVAEDDSSNIQNSPSKIDVTTTDVNNPAFVTENSTPNDNAINVSVSNNIIIDFNENIVKGTGNITIRDVSGSSDFEVFNIALATSTTSPAAGAVGIVSDKVYINPTNNLTGDNNFSIRIDATTIDDANGNSFAGITNDTSYNFKTIDNIYPTLNSSSPTDDATDIATNSNIVLTFSENIAFGTGFIQLFKTSDDSVVFSIDAADPAATSNVASISNAVLTINPSGTLDESTGYYLLIPTTSINDTNGNSYAGISAKTTLNFVTADETNPTFSSSSPTDDAIGIATNSNIVLTFNENIAFGTGFIQLFKTSDDSAVFSIDAANPAGTSNVASISNAVLTINPSGTLDESTGYYLLIPTTSIDDTSGNSYAGISTKTTINFVTADETNPTLSSSSPADDATGIATTSNIVLTFNENIAFGTGSIQVKRTSNDTTVFSIDAADPAGTSNVASISNNVLTINPGAFTIVDSTGYYLVIPSTAIDDTSGNSYAGISSKTTINFVTADETRPTLTSSTPADNATGVSTTATIMLDFSESIFPGTGNVTLRDVTSASNVETFNIFAAVGGSTPTNGQISIDGDKLYINPTSNLSGLNVYAIQIANTAIKDGSNNTYLGITNETTLNFTTLDNIPPTFDGANSLPADNAININISNNIALDFNENIAIGTGNITLRNVTTNSTVQVFDITNATATTSPTTGNIGLVADKVYLNPNSNLIGETVYSIQIDATAIDDTNGNSFAGISDDTTYNFTTLDNTNPTFVSANSTPNDDATDVSLSDNIVIDFSENILKGTGNLIIRDVTGNSNFESFDLATATATTTPSTGNIGIVNDKVYVNPTTNFTGENVYAIRIDATGIDDANGRSFAGISDDTTFNFTTADVTAPTFDSANSTPNDNATNVSVSNNIIIDFSENVALASGLGAGNITIRDVTGNSNFETFAVNIISEGATTTPSAGAIGIVNDKIYINPTNNLSGENVYAIRIDTSAVDDTSGNSFAGISDDTTYNFTTADVTAPTLSSSSPSDNATGVLVSANIVLTFNENISKGTTGNIVIKKTTDDSTIETIAVTSGLITVSTTQATINPSSDLALNTEYYVQIDNTAFKDAADNNYAGISNTTDLSFTTEANQTNNFIATNSNWSTISNWSLGRAPISTDNIVVLGTNYLTVNVENAVVNNVTLTNGQLYIAEGKSLTINGNLNNVAGDFSILSNATANGSLIVNGTSTGNVRYLRYVSSSATASRGWHILSSPVIGQSISDRYTSVVQNGTKRGIAPYVNTNTANNKWSYYTTADSPGNFVASKGYSVKRSTAGNFAFRGTLNTDDVTIQIDATGDQYNAIGNPFTSYINSETFLNNTTAGRLTEKTIWLWDEAGNAGAGEYAPKGLAEAYKIAPGQGFFVQALATGNVTFGESIQTHVGGNTFLKQSERPEIKLSITDGTNLKYTKVFYIVNKTTGFDDGYDNSMFNNGTSDFFTVFTQLVSDNEGKNLAVQTLPNSNYENMIVPVGVKSEAGKEITFSLTNADFPTGMKIFLEDRENNTFTRLDETNSNYKITLTNAENGIGRFYLYTTQSSLSVDKNESLDNVSVYKLNNTTLRIAGLNQEKAAISIFNILGKLVLKTSFTSNGVKDVALPDLSKGVYLVKIQTNSGKLNKKIVLE